MNDAARINADRWARGRSATRTPAQWSLRARRALGVGRRQPGSEGGGAHDADTEPRAAIVRPSCPHRVGGVERAGLGSVRVARDDDRSPPRRIMCAAVEPRRLRGRCRDDPIEHRRGWWEDLGEGNQDPPAATHRPGPSDARPAPRLSSPHRRAGGRIGDALPEDGFVFSPDPDGSTWPKPGTATQRYSRMCARLGYSMHLHQLRHHSATELISAGVDARTVAGRLGHGGGGATTLRVYSAWVAEADQGALVRWRRACQSCRRRPCSSEEHQPRRSANTTRKRGPGAVRSLQEDRRRLRGRNPLRRPKTG